MNIELFLIIAFAIIGVLLALWVTVASCVIDDLRTEIHNLKALLAYKRRQDLAAKGEKNDV